MWKVIGRLGVVVSLFVLIVFILFIKVVDKVFPEMLRTLWNLDLNVQGWNGGMLILEQGVITLRECGQQDFTSLIWPNVILVGICCNFCYIFFLFFWSLCRVWCWTALIKGATSLPSGAHGRWRKCHSWLFPGWDHTFTFLQCFVDTVGWVKGCKEPMPLIPKYNFLQLVQQLKEKHQADWLTWKMAINLKWRRLFLLHILWWSYYCICFHLLCYWPQSFMLHLCLTVVEWLFFFLKVHFYAVHVSM